MKKFDIEATVSFDVSMYQVEAENMDEAIIIAKEKITEAFNLDYIHARLSHNPDEVVIGVDAFDLEDYD